MTHTESTTPERAEEWLAIGRRAHADGRDQDARTALLAAAGLSAAAHDGRILGQSLTELSTLDVAEAVRYAAQGVWLSLHTEMTPTDVLRCVTRMNFGIGGDAELAALAMAYASVSVPQRARNSENLVELLVVLLGLQAECAMPRGIEPDGLKAWLRAQGLDRVDRIRPRLVAELETWFSDTEWLFDRGAWATTFAGPSRPDGAS